VQVQLQLSFKLIKLHYSFQIIWQVVPNNVCLVVVVVVVVNNVCVWQCCYYYYYYYYTMSVCGVCTAVLLKTLT